MFCRIVAGQAPAVLIAETPATLAFVPLMPATEGHTLVIPKEHVPDLWQASPATAAAVTDEVIRLGNVIRAALRADGMNLVTSAGAAASQTVFHLHMHLVPRWAGDKIGALWPHSDPALESQMEQMAAKIRARL